MRNTFSILVVVLLTVFLSGCGETINGMVRDTKRVGAGIHKVFVCDEK
ncbi:MAG: hypothetical protein ABIH74_02725 [Candidatus Omnitrophota bacterium]